MFNIEVGTDLRRTNRIHRGCTCCFQTSDWEPLQAYEALAKWKTDKRTNLNDWQLPTQKDVQRRI